MSNKIKLCVAQEIEVDEAEWMDKFGEAIVAKQIVPAVAFEKTIRAATRDGMMKYGLKSLEFF